MVLSTQSVVQVARVSASVCQYIACNPERLNSDEVLDLIFCFPFQQIRRLSLCLWTFFCFPVGGELFFNPLSTSTSSASSSSLSSSSSSSPAFSAVNFLPAGSSSYDYHSD